MIFVSPQPNKWYEIYQGLKAYWENEIRASTASPPVALVLSGWTFSNDYDKQERWELTLKWAEINNCGHLIPLLNEEEKYYIKEYSSYRPYEYHTYDKKYKPTKEEVVNAIELIKEKWKSLMGEEFGNKTNPDSFSGNKSRSLLVFYKPEYTPPWGSWTNHLANGKPSKFTELRSKVNELIKPLAVDHIMFKEEKKIQQ